MAIRKGTKTTDQFITEAQAVHGDKYDYSQSHYESSAKKIEIICPKHGKFQQSPNAHVSARLGCRLCRSDNMRKSNIKDVTKFIAEAALKHNQKYDYSLVKYLHSKSKVNIICNLHGVFEQTPNAHLLGQGCKFCGIALRSDNAMQTNNEFIENARNVHGDLYDYKFAQYMGSKSKIEIVCSTHGIFKTTPDSHINRGSGCPLCSSNSKSKKMMMTYDEFIIRAQKIHNGIYSYENSKSMIRGEKIPITCNKHGVFFQLANIHLMGSGCQKCGGNLKLTTEDFIQRASIIHSCFYDYSKSKYILGKNNIVIICPKHGEFKQSAAAHLAGQGCIKCSNRETLGRTRFIERATEIHGDRYDYSRVVYSSNKADVEIGCATHGFFMQQAKGHLLRGNGCPKCKLNSDSDAIYIWKAIGQFFNGEQVYKVGYTSVRLAEDRIKYVAGKARMEYEIVLLEEVGGNIYEIEKTLLKIGFNPRYTGHSGASEFRAFTDNDLISAISLVRKHVINQKLRSYPI